MLQPKPLQKGDSVAIISIARKISIPEIQIGIDLLQKWGLKVIIGKTIGLEDNQFAGNKKERLNDLQSMLDNPTIKAIWFGRGGYGSVQIIDDLNFDLFLKNPKWLIGYSDITVIHSHLNRIVKCETIHATMPINLRDNTPKALDSLHKALFNQAFKIETPANINNKLGKAKGQLIGGNLSIIYSLLGSNSTLKTEGKILFLEDLDEYLYHIDRMLINLKRNNIFEGLAGLIIGGMTDMNDNTIPFGSDFKDIILEYTKEYNFPICFDFPTGHINDNRALITGRNHSLLIEDNFVTLSHETQ